MVRAGILTFSSFLVLPAGQIETFVYTLLAKITLWYLFFGEGKNPWLNRAHDGQ